MVETLLTLSTSSFTGQETSNLSLDVNHLETDYQTVRKVDPMYYTFLSLLSWIIR